MDPHNRLLQRSLDGELGPAEHAALEHLLAADETVRTRYRQLEALHSGLVRIVAARPARDGDRLVAAVCSRLPQRPPRREAQMTVLEVVVTTALVAIIGSLYGLAGTLRDLLPLTIIAMCSIVVGALCIAAAGPLLRAEAKATTRLLHKRIAMGNADIWTFRVVGLAIVVGGIWLAR